MIASNSLSRIVVMLITFLHIILCNIPIKWTVVLLKILPLFYYSNSQSIKALALVRASSANLVEVLAGRRSALIYYRPWTAVVLKEPFGCSGANRGLSEAQYLKPGSHLEPHWLLKSLSHTFSTSGGFQLSRCPTWAWQDRIHHWRPWTQKTQRASAFDRWKSWFCFLSFLFICLHIFICHFHILQCYTNDIFSSFFVWCNKILLSWNSDDVILSLVFGLIFAHLSITSDNPHFSLMPWIFETEIRLKQTVVLYYNICHIRILNTTLTEMTLLN